MQRWATLWSRQCPATRGDMLGSIVRVVLAALVPVVPVAAQESWPSRTVKLIVPFAAGGNTDVVGRITANYMQTALNGAAVVVENRAGGGGIAGTQAVANSAPDGYTLCVWRIGPISVAVSTLKL